MNKEELTDNQRERLIRLYWQFDGVDVSDIPEHRRNKFCEKLAQQPTKLNNLHRTTDKFKSSKSRATSNALVPSIRGALTSILVFGLLFASFTLIRNARAEQDRVAQNVRFAQSMSDFLFEIYEENPMRTAQLLDKIDAVFPTYESSADDTDKAKVTACRLAVRCLLASRQGHASESSKRLKIAKQFMEKRQPSEIGVLDFLFFLTVGKAGLEANDVRSLRLPEFRATAESVFSPQETSYALQEAHLILNNGIDFNWSDDELAILHASLLTDLARAKGRYVGVQFEPANQADESAEELLILAKMKLDEVNSSSSKAHLAELRQLNNYLLRLPSNWDKLGKFEDPEEFEREIERLKNEVETLCQTSVESGARTDAIRFERALCYSNLADILYERVNGKYQNPEKYIRISLPLRKRAISILTAIPRSARSERCHENLVLNRTRSLSSRIRYVSDSLQSSEIHVEALALDNELGGVLDCMIGQFPAQDRLAIALVIRDRYSNQRLLEYSSTINLDSPGLQDTNLLNWFNLVLTTLMDPSPR